MSLLHDLQFSLKPRCPVCRKGRLFDPWSLKVKTECEDCGAQLGNHDIGDAAAVLMIFFLGFLLVPLAWGFEVMFAPPLWVHPLLWGTLGLGLIILGLPAVKAYIILLEYRHRR